MSTTSLEWWARNLPKDEAQRLLICAAREHTRGFSNPEEIGEEWASNLSRNGYNALCPYARNYLAHKYLDHRQSTAA